MRPIITVTAVVLLHLCVIAVLVGVNGCRSTSGFEQDGDPAVFSAGARAPSASSSSATAVAPSAAPAPVTQIATPAPTKSAPIKAAGPGGVHVVVQGETLAVIAAREKVSIGALAAANGLARNAVLKAGQKLKIPAAPKPAATTAKASSSTAAAAPAPTFAPLKIVTLSAPSAAPAPAKQDTK